MDSGIEREEAAGTSESGRQRDTLGKVQRVAREADRRGAVLILIAERDPMTAQLEEFFLKEAGYDVRIVHDGRLAVAAARDLKPDLIVLDVILPGLSGLRVCELLKADRETQDIPVLVFSALDVRERAAAAGADAFLLKPIERPLLVDAVSDLLGKRPGGDDAAHQ